MPKLQNQKLKLLFLLKILMDKTDTEHTLTAPELIKELNKYNINAERKSIYHDTESLKIFGIDILCRKSKYMVTILQKDYSLNNNKLVGFKVC